MDIIKKNKSTYPIFRFLSPYDDFLLFLIIATITINVMAMTITTPATAPAIIGSISVPGELEGVVTAHSGSLKDQMWTVHVGSMSRISPSTAIKVPLDTHCWI